MMVKANLGHYFLAPGKTFPHQKAIPNKAQQHHMVRHSTPQAHNVNKIVSTIHSLISTEPNIKSYKTQIDEHVTVTNISRKIHRTYEWYYHNLNSITYPHNQILGIKAN